MELFFSIAPAVSLVTSAATAAASVFGAIQLPDDSNKSPTNFSATNLPDGLSIDKHHRSHHWHTHHGRDEDGLRWAITNSGVPQTLR